MSFQKQAKYLGHTSPDKVRAIRDYSLPNKFSSHIGVFILPDHMSKFNFLERIKEINAQNILRFLGKRVLLIFGIPEPITTNDGVQLKSFMFNPLLENCGVHHNSTAFCSPQSNASERGNRSVLTAIRA